MSNIKLTEQEIQRAGFGHNVHEVEKDYSRPVIDRPSREAFPSGAEIDSRDLDRASKQS
jgi:hypothetical protein